MLAIFHVLSSNKLLTLALIIAIDIALAYLIISPELFIKVKEDDRMIKTNKHGKIIVETNENDNNDIKNWLEQDTILDRNMFLSLYLFNPVVVNKTCL